MLFQDDDHEMLRLVAAAGLGWTQVGYNVEGVLMGRPPRKKIIRPVPSYADDIRAAWEIVEFLATLQIGFKIENRALAGYVRNYLAEMGNEKLGKVHASHLKAPVAICLAFRELKKKLTSGNVEYEVKEEGMMSLSH
jgi:hypothetical protein